MKLNHKECLLIEDLPIDQEIIKYKMASSFPNIKVIKVNNGEDALHFLQKRLDTGQAIPFLLLVDINMPMINGFEFLEACIKMGFTKTERPKIAIITSSIHPADSRKARYYNIVDEFFIKPLDMDRLERMMLFAF